MGEKLEAESRRAATEAGEGENGLDTEDDPESRTRAVFNKRGAIRLGLLSSEARAELREEGDEDGRAAHDAPLTPEAKAALAELRIIKDASDGWARDRDAQALVKGRRAERRARIAAGEATAEELEDEAEGKQPGRTGGDEELGFCDTCFTPEVADPRPDQLFIWLHALRYRTTEWDWSSELPYWALETWNGE